MSTSPITSNLAALFGTNQSNSGTNSGSSSNGTGSGGSTTNGTSGSGTTTGTNGLPSGQSLNNMFLQLLVAQLQHQDPTSPVDPSQFVGQLAQFSELSEVTSIYTLLQQVVSASGGAGSGSGSGGTSGGTTTPGTTTGGTATGGTATGGATTNSIANGSAVFPTFSPSSAAAALPSSGKAPGTPVSGSFATPSIADLLSKIQGVF